MVDRFLTGTRECQNFRVSFLVFPFLASFQTTSQEARSPCQQPQPFQALATIRRSESENATPLW